MSIAERVTRERDETAQATRRRTVHGLFEEQVACAPDRVAVEFEGATLTYAQLNQRANRLARYLQMHHLGTEERVAVYMERSLNMVVGLLGILKAGAAYVPLDPAYPGERIQFILDDAQVSAVLTAGRLGESLPETAAPVIDLDASRNEIERARDSNLESAASSMGASLDASHNLAYVIYTSGSTGKPKGVQIEHHSVVNFIESMQREPGLDANDTLVAVTTLSFDIAGLELYVPLSVGARIVIASRAVASDGARLGALLAASHATVMQATPVTWRLLLQQDWRGDPGLKILVGGEALPRPLADALLECGREVWNLYGPTETTIWSTVYRVTPGEGPVPIGRPIANTQVYILNEHREPIAAGEVGELYIGGAGVARGYLNRPELTREKFISVPSALSPQPSVVYRTGDLVRQRPDGAIEFIGRADQQIKLRGYRIELGEIEHALSQHPDVREAAVLLRTDADDSMYISQQLVGYVTSKAGAHLSPRELRAFLTRKLPLYMVPAIFVVLDALPHTPNGKLDRRALPAPYGVRAVQSDSAVAPRTAVEKQLASIWQEALGLERVGVHDDFFELGGDSLRAGRVFAAIHTRMGVNLLPPTLLQAPTIAALARMIDEGNVTPMRASLVPIQPRGSRSPVFLMHAGAGTVLFYRELAQQLDGARPVYGLQAQGLYGRTPPHRRVDEMAAHYLKEIRGVQARGPYYFGGFCFGAILAFEMAQQLREQGETVELLASFDGPAPAYDKTPPAWLAEQGRKHSPLQQVRQRLKLGVQARKVQYAVFHRFKSALPTSLRERYFLENNYRAERAYTPRVYPGKMVLFELADEFPDADLGWGKWVAGGVEIHIIPGRLKQHRDLMDKPYVSLVAQKLGDYLVSTNGHIE